MHYFSGKGCFEFLESMHYCIGILKVIYEGKEIDLTPREFEVLYLLALKPNWVMPKTNIYHSVWGIHYHDNQILLVIS
ncbi:winged helix-turn-helix domain-containing protein [Coprococcus comes]|uniref:winged helix-turn-helix domain-containing protein n=1 Tax=Coprococcus comes TaxID=410072 RepID=UPI001899C6D4